MNYQEFTKELESKQISIRDYLVSTTEYNPKDFQHYFKGYGVSKRQTKLNVLCYEFNKRDHTMRIAFDCE